MHHVALGLCRSSVFFEASGFTFPHKDKFKDRDGIWIAPQRMWSGMQDTIFDETVQYAKDIGTVVEIVEDEFEDGQ